MSRHDPGERSVCMDGCVCTMDVYVLTVGEMRIFEAERPARVKVLRLKRIQEAQA